MDNVQLKKQEEKTMRTLKKVLALTVVLATLLSISAFAAFSDEESIDESFVDAVNLLGALNVMTGDTEGTFRPNDTISRAEAAKMIYVIRNGGVDDQAAGWTGMSTFSDVTPGVWFEGYVNYCASLGIIAGIGGGKFNPSGAVTGVELAKMMLVVADYNPNIEGYTGTGWNLNVIRDAQSAKMFEGYTLAYSAAATRQQAAQLFSNAILNTEMAIYIGDVRLNSAAGLGNAQTVGERFFSLQTATGVLTKVPHVDLATSPATLNTSDNDAQLEITTVANGVSSTATRNFVFDVDASLLEQEVEVIYKETSNGINTNLSSILDNKDTVYGVIATGTSTVYETTMDGITLELADTTKAFNKTTNPVTIKFDGYNSNRAKALTADAELPVITNLYETVIVKNAVESDGKTVVGADSLAMKSTAAVRFVDTNGDGNLDVAFVTTPIYGTVNTYNADRNDFSTTAKLAGRNITSNRNAVNFENFAFEDELEKDDVIAISIDVTSGEILYTVALVDPIVGDLTRVTKNDGTITVGGTAYGFYEGEFNGTAPEAKVDNYGSSDLGKELTLYTDGKYIFKATDGTSGKLGTNFAFVQKISEGRMTDFENNITKVQLVLADGTTKVYDYKVPTTNSGNYFSEGEITAKHDTTKFNFVGRIVEYKTSGSTVAFYKVPSLTADSKNGVQYGAASSVALDYNRDSSIFVKGAISVMNGDESVYFLPSKAEKNDSTTGNIDSVTVLKGSELKGTATINANQWTGGDYVNTGATGTMLISSPVSGIQTVAYAVLDASSSMSVSGTYLYTTSASYIDRIDSTNSTAVDGVLSSDADSTGGAVKLESGSNLLGNKLYKITAISSGAHTAAEINVNDASSSMKLDAITGRNESRRTVQIGNGLYSIDGDTRIFVVDTETGEIFDGDFSYLTVANKDENNVNFLKNVLFEADNENVLNVVYVEIGGDSIESLVTYSASSSVDLSTADTNLSEPVINSKPSLNLKGDEDFTGSVTKLEKLNGNNYEDAASLDDAAAIYRVTVVLKAKTGNAFDDTVTVKLPTGYTATSVTTSVDGKTLTIVATVAVQNTTIDLSTLTLDVLVDGETVDFATFGFENLPAAGLNGTPSTKWTKGGSDNSANEAVVGGTEYVATLELTAEGGYVFDTQENIEAGLAAVKANGYTVAVTRTSDTEVTITATVTPDKLIDGVELSGLTQPTNGTALSGTGTLVVTESTEVTPAVVGWYNDAACAEENAITNAVAASSRNYVKITLTAQDGYAFASDFAESDVTVESTMTGAGYTVTTDSFSIADGVVTIVLEVESV